VRELEDGVKLNQLLVTFLDFPLSFFTNSTGADVLGGGDIGEDACLVSLKADFSGW
jgi:hypothetical protein